jgi:hypothetical protein
LKAFGKPKPSAPNGLQFKPSATRGLWEDVWKKIGSGYLKDRFLFLFGEGVDDLSDCLKTWSFAVPPSKKRVILGRNAYGAILYIDNAENAFGHVYVVDPTVPHVFSSPDLNFLSLLGSWLPEGNLDYFLDDGVYKEWRKKTKQNLGPNEVLAMKVPRGLGGQMKLDNFNVEDIHSFYKTTAPIYAKALGKAGDGKKRGN